MSSRSPRRSRSSRDSDDEEDPLRGKKKDKKGKKKKDKKGKKKKDKSSGGSSAGTMVGVLVLALVAGGYFMWTKSQETEDPVDRQTEVPQPPGVPPPPPPPERSPGLGDPPPPPSPGNTQYGLGCEPEDDTCCDHALLDAVPGCDGLGEENCGVFVGCCSWNVMRETCLPIPEVPTTGAG